MMTNSLYHRCRRIGAMGLFAVLFLSLLSACRQDNPDNKFRGTNKVQLSFSDGSRTKLIDATSTAPLKVTVRLTSRRSDAVQLQVRLTGEGASALALSTETLTIPAGQLEGTFELTSSGKEVKTQQQAQVSLIPISSGLTVDNTLTITLSPFPVWTPTAAQQALIDGYRAKGIDLSMILGYHTVEGSVDWAGFSEYEYGEGIRAHQTWGIDKATMLVTLSDRATADQPVLKFAYNAFGLNDIYKRIWDGYTINNLVYFYAEGASSLEVMKAINWTQSSAETFNVVLDNIRVDASSGTLAFTGKRVTGMPATYPLREEEKDSPIVVPFTYESSVWKRVMAKIDADPTFKEKVEMAGENMELYKVLSNTGIDEDRSSDIEAPVGHYVKPEGKIDFKKGTLSFTFPFHGYNSDYYSVVKVTSQHRK